MISPAQMEMLAEEIRRLYADAETEMLRKIANRINRGMDATDWHTQKLAEISQLREEMTRIVEALRTQAPVTIEQILTQTYAEGALSAEADLRAVGITMTSAFVITNTRAIGALVSSTLNTLTFAHTQILRSTMDVYRSVIAESVRGAITGVNTRREIAQLALNRFADKGVGGFVDNRGRNWDLSSYTEMATRTAIGQTAIQGHVDRMVADGRDLVMVSDHAEECPICRPWEGKILSISGNTEGYPSVAQARAGGLWHPSCGHTISAYIEGLTRPITPTHESKGYENRQKQRYMERQLRQWKRRESVALSEEERKKARAKIREWQARLRQHTQDTGLRRKYEREQVENAR